MVSTKEVKDDLSLLISSANDHSAVTQGTKNIQRWGVNKHVIMPSDDEQMNCYPIKRVYPLDILSNSGHRDGSIYRSIWNKQADASDRSETRLEAKMHSEPTSRCLLRDGVCIFHAPSNMLQVFSLKLANIPVDSGSVELYGYIAVRDGLDRLLNYVVNFSRDDPIIVEQGALINMNGPKRAIHMYDTVFIEYDMKIKTGQQEKDDLQLIDGLSFIDDTGTWNRHTITRRINGDSGAVDLTFLRLERAVQGTVEVSISEVKCSFKLSLGCILSRLNEEICLFDGNIGGESSVLRSSVVAVNIDSGMDLKFKFGSESSISVEVCSFEASNHGVSTQQIKTDIALISVTVTWSALLE
ncbi:uncharacterized protein LOC100821934 [Brachypodium distachyon]|nr:uncharacterized protein LOC100821934 [Brachypodium distachyon]|eukprot:XP_010236488.2 uncharacterized protein LOC100821934 [Brachypodium distachyon]